MTKEDRREYNRLKMAKWRELPENRDKGRAASRKWYKENKAKRRAYRYKALYGITIEQYDALKIEQSGRCAICRRIPKKFAIDHDHITGKVRGLLCNSCNTGLGKLGDDMEGLLKAIEYLKKWL